MRQRKSLSYKVTKITELFMEYASVRDLMVKRHIVILSLLFFIANLGIIGNSSAQNTDDMLIESDITWTEGQNIDGVVKILDGGKLTIIDSEIIFSPESSLEIDKGGLLVLEQTKFTSENIPSDLKGYGYCDEFNRSTIILDTTSYDNNFEIILESSANSNFNGATAYIQNEVLTMNNSEFSYIIQDNISSVERLIIGLCGYGSTPISLSTVSVVYDGVTEKYLASDLEYRNMMISGFRDYTLDITGDLKSYNSTIIGANIIATGNIELVTNDLIRSGPILLNDDNASITLTNTKIIGSLDDHDIRAMPESEINWSEDTTGSGDLTDKWERRIMGQYLQFDAVWVEYQIKGLYGIDTYTNFSNADGISYIDGGRERIIEIGWSDDNIWAVDDVWREDAIINVIKYRTAWNPENSEIGNYGISGLKLTNDKIIIIDQNTPNIKWVSLESEESNEEAIGSIVMLGKVVNEGTAAAHVAITCYINSSGENAETDNYPNVLVDAGEIGEIIFDWRNSKAGNEELKCVILTPTQIVEEDSFGGGNMTSETINWKVNEDEVGFSYVIPILIVISLGIIIIGYVLVNRASIKTEINTVNPDTENNR